MKKIFEIVFWIAFFVLPLVAAFRYITGDTLEALMALVTHTNFLLIRIVLHMDEEKR